MRAKTRVRRAPPAVVLLAALGASLAGGLSAQTAAAPALRPLPAPVVAPPQYRRAVGRGTRTADGRPGPRYWTNHSAYDIRARLDPATGVITGSETIVYTNNSPDTLTQLVLHLHMNLHKEGVVRNEPAEITGGVELGRVTLDGTAITQGSLNQPGRWAVAGTVMRVRPRRPVPPGGRATLALDWSETFPQASSGRVGWTERELYFIGYWYPRMAVYDDLRGWDAQPYLGNAEFYDDFGDYRAALTVPAGWTVMATGTLENPAEVWSAQTRARVAAAATADSVVHVATAADLTAGRVLAAAPGGTLTYRFAADTVRDFTWTTSNAQVWDATSARVADRNGDGREDRVLIHAFWRADIAPLWRDVARFGKHSVEHLSRATGLTYPWPHMTVVEGEDIIGGGMEFPMLTLIGAYTGTPPGALYGTTVHEVAHMWVPMIVGANEKRHAWMDEGAATFMENVAKKEFYPGDSGEGLERENWLSTARSEGEGPLMTHGDAYETVGAYFTASYPKPASLMVALRGLLGQETFDRGWRTFLSEWAFKLPTPWDFFATFERAAGRDLDWFWTAFYYETWTLDQAVGGVASGPAGSVVTIENKGFAPMPARVRIQTTRGGTLDREVPVETWLGGAVRADITLPASVGEVTRVLIDPDGLFPDMNRRDNLWTAPR